MKKKQLISIIVTGAVIVAVGVTGIVSNVISNQLLGDQPASEASMFSDIFSDEFNETEITLPEDDFIGVINVVGEIGASDAESFSSASGYNHDLYMNYIDEMIEAKNNKAIMLYVDSPGGAVYQSDELYQKLMEYKEKTSRPVWAYFASQACSGGYYISMAADKIYANRNNWTGSIGVIISLMNCKELYDKLGVKEIDITSGKNKAMGSMGLELTEEQYDILQSLVDEAYDQFVGIVADGRKMDKKAVQSLADGRIYSAYQAKENGLIDEISLWEEAKNALIEKIACDKEIEFYAPENKMSDFFGSLFGSIEKIIPKSDASLAADIMENNGNGVLKYYAK